jgi:ATP-dependent Lhr-like helicase
LSSRPPSLDPDLFHPLVRRWFESRFGAPTAPQARAWPLIASRRDVLVSAPTGSGKTLAAFLAALDGLFREALAGPLPEATRVLYVSPLRALSNDIERNLNGPLAELRAAAAAEGLPAPELRVLVRTGDTPSAQRQAIIRRPPHILVTTPESLYLLLTAERGRALLASVETAIVDEIHAVARDKRGAHLALSLERLEAIARRRPQRIGLSATVEPVEEIARFLVGAARVGPSGQPRCDVVEEGRRRPLDLGVEVPDDELSSIASNELWAATYDRIAALVQAHRSTIVFVNTRRLAERAAHALGERLGEDAVAPHHGSLARERRLQAEERLKGGELRAIVATASLELGIDVGAVELVVQIGSPGALGVGLQRIGRSGHVDGAIPRGRLFPMTRDELVECAALVRGLRRGRIEATRIPDAPLDVLAQQLVAEAACGPIHLANLHELVCRAWPYRALPRDRFDAVVEMLAEGIARGAGRTTALLHRDGVNGRVRGRRAARIAALTGAGTIPDTAQYAVVAEPEGAVIGQVDEDFAVESLAGDVFLLGNTAWRIRRVESGVLRVEDARGASPTVPFWNGEAPGRSQELSDEVSQLREEVERRLGDPAGALQWLEAEAALPEAGARQLLDYLAAGRAALGALPTRGTLVAERFFDEAGGMQLVVHAPLGARTNRAFGLALRKRFCRTFDFELQAAATDEGVLLSLGSQHSFPLETIFSFLSEATLDEVLRQAALQAPMFGARWRWSATRALAIPRVLRGRRIPPPIARMRADDLLAAVFPAQTACQDNAPGGPIEIPDHPLVEEALRDCLTEAMDAAGLRELLGRIRQGEVRLVAVDTPEPSPLSHELLGARPWAYLDDAPLEERRARAVAIRRSLPPADAVAFGALDPEAIAEVTAQVWPDVRDGDELHDALLDLVAVPAAELERAGWTPLARELHEAGRAFPISPSGAQAARRVEAGWWVAAERLELARAIVRGDAEAATTAVRGWIARVGPATADVLGARMGLDPAAVATALLSLEAEGLVLRGRFLPGAPWSREAPHFCERTALARIHRLTLGRLRREIEPVTTADLLRFLARWQHVAPGTRLHGARGLAEVIGQLQGFHAAAGAWERDLLAARVAGFEPALLDGLCLSGEVAWGRLAVAADPEPGPRRPPTRAAPITLVLREDLGWLLDSWSAETSLPPLGPAARDLAAALARRGASFPADLAAETGRLAREIEAGLWELVNAGIATCDGFAGLRALLSAGRARPGTAARGGGRWSLLRGAPTASEAGPPRARAPELLERVAQQYLRRYGVVFRDLLARESAPPWRDLVRVYRALEARGTVRGGRFVAGRSGEQFALAEAVDALRAVRRARRDGVERVEVSAADPLNLVGILTPGPRIPAGVGGRVAYVDGIPAGSSGPAGEAAAS